MFQCALCNNSDVTLLLTLYFCDLLFDYVPCRCRCCFYVVDLVFVVVVGCCFDVDVNVIS